MEPQTQMEVVASPRETAPAAPEVAEVLEAARRHAGLSRDELWARYWRLGGRAKRSALISYLKGQTEPQVSQYNVIAQALNEALEAAGKDIRLPILAFEFNDANGAEDDAQTLS